MSTDITTLMTDHKATEFWGGDERGVCLQITALSSAHEETFIQLTTEEAKALISTLVRFVKAGGDGSYRP